jgi:hypothetical protein
MRLAQQRMASSAPTILKMKLPSGRRRSSAAARLVTSIARMPLPTLAPSTRPSATVPAACPAPPAWPPAARWPGWNTTAPPAPRRPRCPAAPRWAAPPAARAPPALRQRPGGADDQLQRQRDQPQADQHAADAPGGAVLPADEHHHADEDQQRRQPRQVEREHHRHQRGAHVGAQHHRQRGRWPPGRCRRRTPRSGRWRCCSAPGW